MDNSRIYKGEGNRHDSPFADAWAQLEPYITSKSLIDAVNTAIYLRRPLLLEGEPGCGKTRLAYAVAYELGYPLHTCYIRSSSRAQDLLYDYDALRRLYDIQEGKVANNTTGQVKALSKEKYVTLGEFGNAIKQSQEDIPSVVLIDEIDKADIDFPNDLLLELDRLQFQVKEAPDMKYDALKGKTRKERRDCLPLIIITSNREKELPQAFLRRCLFYYLEFPSKETLKQIIQRHFDNETTPIFELALTKFLTLRNELKSWRKIPGTSEFLDWLEILKKAQSDNQLNAEDFKNTDVVNLPYLETLVKTQSDRNALNSRRRENG
ncbi:MoxR family ATPase [Nostoc sphaeroides CHAB 2801]|uniref:AAA family ATPase n=1 Tax=Nostoc sphaeroides TaxID=446679 RepID=UPI000E478008|nr:MoxR family ATPase [Nostoc sphaeroides]MCC5628132.1 MoxR family ATPase [Nostoc sphaeroides CHAB 2801]